MIEEKQSMGRPYLKFYTSDFFGDPRVEALSPADQAMYLWLLVQAFRDASGALSQGFRERYARLLSTKRCEKLLSVFFEERDGCFYNKRLSKEIAKVEEFSERQSGRRRGKTAVKPPIAHSHSSEPDDDISSSEDEILGSDLPNTGVPPDSTWEAARRIAEGVEQVPPPTGSEDTTVPAELTTTDVAGDAWVGTPKDFDRDELRETAAEMAENAAAEQPTDEQLVFDHLMTHYHMGVPKITAYLEQGLTSADLRAWDEWRGLDPTRERRTVALMLKLGHMRPSELKPEQARNGNGSRYGYTDRAPWLDKEKTPRAGREFLMVKAPVEEIRAIRVHRKSAPCRECEKGIIQRARRGERGAENEEPCSTWFVLDPESASPKARCERCGYEGWVSSASAVGKAAWEQWHRSDRKLKRYVHNGQKWVERKSE